MWKLLVIPVIIKLYARINILKKNNNKWLTKHKLEQIARAQHYERRHKHKINTTNKKRDRFVQFIFKLLH